MQNPSSPHTSSNRKKQQYKIKECSFPLWVGITGSGEWQPLQRGQRASNIHSLFQPHPFCTLNIVGSTFKATMPHRRRGNGMPLNRWKLPIGKIERRAISKPNQTKGWFQTFSDRHFIKQLMGIQQGQTATVAKQADGPLRREKTSTPETHQQSPS